MNDQAEAKAGGAPQWTPGPWTVKFRDGCTDGVHTVFYIVAPDGHTIADGQSMEHLGGEGILEAQCRANAQVMVTAPELYDALEFLATLRRPLEPSDAAMALKVLAKARGEVQS
ncbi:hypothetical protein [Xanthomonas phage NEB7]|nr:hypothetical protein [Xanthomonas phage NEB7]